MDDKSLLKFCRYYKGESSLPKNTNANFWEYEKKWVEMMLSDDPMLSQYLNDYIAYGIGGFEQMDDTPITLKSLLFNRYAHWSIGDIVHGFKMWYKNEYYSEK